MKVCTSLFIFFHFVNASVICQETAAFTLLSTSHTLTKYLESEQFHRLPNDEKLEAISELSNVIEVTRKGISQAGSNTFNNITIAVPGSYQKISGGENVYLNTVYTARPRNVSYGVGVDQQEFPASEDSYPANCYEIMTKGQVTSGIYTIKPSTSPQPFQVLCDMTTQGGGWTHIQKRFDGRLNFERGWTDYKFGFGFLDPGHEFWMGLEKMHHMTADSGTTELLVEVVDRDGDKAFALYKHFAVGREQESYPLSLLSSYDGDAGDSLEWHVGMKFSTYDFDNDLYAENCAALFKSGWWYNACFSANLNGKFTNVDLPQSYVHMGIHWAGFKSLEYCHARARMLIRPTQY